MLFYTTNTLKETKDIATRRVTTINLISIIYVRAEKSCNSSKKT